mmetsp:Transcript_19941/g.53708  ORF Transcript_19941/g.53708 Transcript_19941/m.53708 type:complete len:209 (-) Transcript_19941:284-910(-)
MGGPMGSHKHWVGHRSAIVAIRALHPSLNIRSVHVANHCGIELSAAHFLRIADMRIWPSHRGPVAYADLAAMVSAAATNGSVRGDLNGAMEAVCGAIVGLDRFLATRSERRRIDQACHRNRLNRCMDKVTHGKTFSKSYRRACKRREAAAESRLRRQSNASNITMSGNHTTQLPSTARCRQDDSSRRDSSYTFLSRLGQWFLNMACSG